MKSSTISKQWSNTTDLFSTLAVKSHKLSTLWLMLFTLLLLPARMWAQTTTPDPRCALFNNLDGITDVTITDHTSYPWQLLNLKADGMDKLGFTIPEGSTGLMSGNYHKENSTSYTEVNFKVEKPLLLTFKFLVSSEYYDKATITLDDKEYSKISKIKQIEIKELLSVGSHTLKLSYSKDDTGNYNADRAFIYDLKTATSFSEYVAEYDATNAKLTFKKITSDNLEGIDLNLIPIVKDGLSVDNLCADYNNITNIVFEESFKTYAPTSLKGFFQDGIKLQTISGLEYLNTADVKDMRSMFNRCYLLKSLNLTNFNTEKVKDMGYMFYNCYRLPPLDLTNFNTENVEDMQGMFKGCHDLTSLDLTSFNTENVKDMNSMFHSCDALTTIYASDKFVTTKVTKGSDMFNDCVKLKGFIEYKNNTDKNNSEFANYKTGYFTKLVGKNGEEKIGAVGETLTAESLALDDNKDFVAYEPFAATTASYSREMKTGTTWATLCLPFEVSLAGKNFRAFKLLSANETTNTVELEEIKTTIEAGTPVIIKMNEGQTALNFSVANQVIAKDVNTAAATEGNYQLQGLYTQKVFSKETDNNCYIVKGDKLMNPAKLLENTKVNNVTSKPFRAYMVDKSATSSTAGAKMYSIGFGNDGTTGIDSLNTIANDKAIYYDLQGNRLNAPQKGINIVKRGGKTMKVIIK